MAASRRHHITDLLAAIDGGDPRAMDALLPLVYGELRRLAGGRMRREPAGHTLTPTALVHEAYLRLVGDGSMAFASRAHFFGAAAEAMRRILVERARRVASRRHGGGLLRVELEDGAAAEIPPSEELLEVDRALERLERLDAGMASVVKLRYYVGMTVEETADALETSPRTVHRQWRAAKGVAPPRAHDPAGARSAGMTPPAVLTRRAARHSFDHADAAGSR